MLPYFKELIVNMIPTTIPEPETVPMNYKQPIPILEVSIMETSTT